MPEEDIRVEPLPLMYCKPLATGIEQLKHEYVLEPKLDGIRLQVVIDRERPRLYTRTNHPATGKMPIVEEALGELPAGIILDGEAVFIDPNGVVDFNKTARIMGSEVTKAVQKQAEYGWSMTYVVFDILHSSTLGDIRSKPWIERRDILDGYLRLCPINEFVIMLEPGPATLDQHRINTEVYGEGSILKRVDAPYEGKRSSHWLKWKKVLDEDVVIMGFTEGKGKYRDQIGAIVFGQYVDGVLVKRGQASGMDDATRLEMSRQPDKFVGRVMVISHNGYLVDGFRHPQFGRFRLASDKRPEDCVWTGTEA